MDYRLRNRDDRWRIIDVIIEGISRVSSYREQFEEVLSSQGVQGLLDDMRCRNAESRTASE